MSATCARIQPILLSVLRIVTAYLFLLHGTSKFFGFPTAMGSGSPEGLMLVAGILEIVGGILLVGGQTVFEHLLGMKAVLSVVVEFAGGLVFLYLVLKHKR